jgi:PAS domain S-box-containing protein
MNRPRSHDDARRVAFVFAATAAAALTVANLVPRLLLADADARLLLRVALDAVFVAGATAFVRRALDGHFGMRDATSATLNEVRRSYRMILSCEAAIVRARSRPELFDAICRVAVEDGGYVAAWIGLAQEDADKSVLPAASAGKDAERASFVRPGFVTWGDEPRGRGPTGTAIRTGRLFSVDDAAAAPQTAPWRELFARLRLGGAVSVPLTLRGTTIGALTLYGEDAGRLPEPERVLLENLAATIDYALDALDRREQEAARFEELRRLSHAVEFSPATIVITDAKGAIEYVNRKFTEVTGYSREEVLGKNPNLLKSGATPKEEYSKLWADITAGREWRGEFQNRAKDGRTFRESASISPIRDASGGISHYIAVKEDITARRALEEQLRQSQKLEAIGALAGGIAHDFNNILTVIRGHCTLLESERNATAATRESIDEIVESVERASALTRQLLAFGRRQTMRPSEVHPNEPVSKMTRMLRRVIPERIEIVVSPSAEPMTVRADPSSRSRRPPTRIRVRARPRPRTAGWSFASATTAPESRKRTSAGSSSRSSRPSRSARAPAWACRWSTGSSASTRASSKSTARRAAGPPCPSSCPSSPRAPSRATKRPSAGRSPEAAKRSCSPRTKRPCAASARAT